MYAHSTQNRWRLPFAHPRRPRGSRAGRKGATKVFKHRRKSPWVPTLTRPFPNGQANAGSWLGTKNALYYCAQSANSISWVLFVSLYTTAINSITACLAHAPKKCTQSGNFQFDINSPFQNTVYPKTTDASPKKYKLERTRGIHACIDHAFINIREIRCHDSWQPRKRRMKSEFAFFQPLSWLFQLAHFVKCKRTPLELNFYQPEIQVHREKENFVMLLVYALHKTWK